VTWSPRQDETSGPKVGSTSLRKRKKNTVRGTRVREGIIINAIRRAYGGGSLSGEKAREAWGGEGALSTSNKCG